MCRWVSLVEPSTIQDFCLYIFEILSILVYLSSGIVNFAPRHRTDLDGSDHLTIVYLSSIIYLICLNQSIQLPAYYWQILPKLIH